ncbi:putative bifunctional diguanylate cyclase/phosphodiesterase [Mesorhizobium sp. ANAO-SY3R2]|uniref:putative bifunctional diguanylate cyclase/phosphodiesterase n=1 Tax=Mesorhizobium sp. ANAO-SY3R2 TaxID=3166644 RepID=UPI003671E86E
MMTFPVRTDRHAAPQGRPATDRQAWFILRRGFEEAQPSHAWVVVDGLAAEGGSCGLKGGSMSLHQQPTSLGGVGRTVAEPSAGAVGIDLDLDRAGSKVKQIQAEFGAYKAALDQHAIVAMTDRSGTIAYVNDLFCQISGYRRSELVGRKHNVVNSGLHPRHFFADMWRTIAGGGLWHGEICNRSKGGALYWVDTTIVPLLAPSGKIQSYVSIRYDITRRKAAEAALSAENEKRREAEALLRDIIEAIPDAVAAFDANDRLVLFNETFKRYYSASAPIIELGISFESILRFGVEIGQFNIARKTPDAREAWIAARMREHRNPGKRVLQQLSDGRWLQMRERQSRTGHVVGVRTDITDLKQAELVIKRQAEQDPLTGLLNRAVLLDRLTDAIAASERSGREGALLLVDLDDFKSVNDTLGHDAGDVLLLTIAQRFREVLRKSDTIARLGGDEFAIIVPNLAGAEDAIRVAEKILACVERPTDIEHRTLNPRCSIGVAMFPSDGDTPKELLKHADIALYQAKAHGRGMSCFFDPVLREGVERRQATGDALRAALAAGEIDIALQPQVRLDDRTHVGFEALARWNLNGHPIAPSEFIPVAEETGLIVPLGLYVLEKSMATSRLLRDRGYDPGPIAVNVAAAQLKQDDFARTVLSMLAQFGLQPSALEIELTENVLLDRASDRISVALHDLHQAGVVIALDDFGTGYASLSHLKRYPVSRLKIDQSFVREIQSDFDDAIIARTIINLAQNLKMSVVAEGVETEQQFEFLKAHGCGCAQGYLISRPIERAEVESYLSITSVPYG